MQDKQYNKREFDRGFKDGVDLGIIDNDNHPYFEGCRKGAERHGTFRVILNSLVWAFAMYFVLNNKDHNCERQVIALKQREQRIVQTYQQTGTLPEDILRAHDVNDLERGVGGGNDTNLKP